MWWYSPMGVLHDEGWKQYRGMFREKEDSEDGIAASGDEMPSSHRITSCRMVMPQEGKSQSDKAHRSCVVGFLLSLWLFFLCTWASLEFFTWIMTAKYYFHEDICILTYTWPIRVESLLIKYREVTNWGILHSLIKQNPEPYLPLVLSVWIPLVPPHCLQGELLPPVMLRSKHGPKFFSSILLCRVETRWDSQEILQSSV